MTARRESPERPSQRAHDIGAQGTVVVAVEAEFVRVHGVEGTEAWLVTPDDEAGLDVMPEPGRLTIRAGPRGSGPFLGLRLGRRTFGFRSPGPLEVAVPHDARVEVDAAAADVAIRDVLGGVRVHSAAGAVSLKRVAGPVTVSGASGDVRVEADLPISLEIRSAAGDVKARAPRFDRVAVETLTGDVAITGRFAPSTEHLVSTVAGDVDLAVSGGLSVAVRTVSGSVDCSHPDRRAGDGGRQRLVIGDGAAHVAVHTLSGDLRVRAPEAADAAAAYARLPPPPSGQAAAPLAPGVPGETAAWGAGEEAALEILEALARGDIDVAEAERRLAGDAASPSPTAIEGRRDE
jgi:hypothetical protein